MARDHLVDHECREFLRIAANSTALPALAVPRLALSLSPLAVHR